MKILYYSPDYYWGLGARTFAREFYAALEDQPDVTYAEVFQRSPEVRREGESKATGKLPFLPASWRYFIRYFKPRIQLTKQIIHSIQSKQIDCLIWSAVDGNKLLIKNIKKSCPNTCICLVMHAGIFYEKFQKIPLRKFWQRLEVSRYSHAHCILVVSSYLKAYLVKRGMSAEKVFVRQNGVNTSIFKNRESFDRTNLRAKYGIPPNAFVLGYVGGMEPFRRLPEVIERFAKLRQIGETNLYLMLAGDGKEMPRVQQAIHENHDVLNGWISCIGWQPYEQVPEIMATFDVGLFPFTHPHCSPLKLFEYMAMGIPTIGPDTPAVREVFGNGEDLVLVDQAGNNFGDSILKLKASAQIREELATKGQRRVLSSFTWNQNGKQVLERIKRSHPNEKN